MQSDEALRKVAVVCFALSLLMRRGRGLSLNRVGTYTFGAAQRHRPRETRTSCAQEEARQSMSRKSVQRFCANDMRKNKVLKRDAL
ncbi:hypothetical protein GFM18_10605 [Rhizobium laguerreae]|nr:hypothetical protein [Rhizobium laguerreae]